MPSKAGLLMALEEVDRQIDSLQEDLDTGFYDWCIGDPYEVLDELRRTKRRLEREIGCPVLTLSSLEEN